MSKNENLITKKCQNLISNFKFKCGDAMDDKK
jgi:hypothetical protein